VGGIRTWVPVSSLARTAEAGIAVTGALFSKGKP
jgi:hypothetical protein